MTNNPAALAMPNLPLLSPCSLEVEGDISSTGSFMKPNPAIPSLVAPKKRIIIHCDDNSSFRSLTPYANDIVTTINITPSTDNSDQNPTSACSVPGPDQYSPKALRTSPHGSFDTLKPLHALCCGSSEINGNDADYSTQMHNNSWAYSENEDSNSNSFPILDGKNKDDKRDEERPVPRKVSSQSAKPALNHQAKKSKAPQEQICTYNLNEEQALLRHVPIVFEQFYRHSPNVLSPSSNLTCLTIPNTELIDGFLRAPSGSYYINALRCRNNYKNSKAIILEFISAICDFPRREDKLMTELLNHRMIKFILKIVWPN
jgi:hypothetical protein